MSRPKKVVSNEECSKFNALRKDYSGKTLSRSKVIELIKKEIGWKQAHLVETVLRRIFVRVSRGVYSFPKDPIYIGKLQGIFDSLSKSRKEVKSIKKEELSDIQKAIKLLKANGFKITKESFDVERALKNPTRTVGDFIVVEEF